jgi:hypothetical protein
MPAVGYFQQAVLLVGENRAKLVRLKYIDSLCALMHDHQWFYNVLKRLECSQV